MMKICANKKSLFRSKRQCGEVREEQIVFIFYCQVLFAYYFAYGHLIIYVLAKNLFD